MCIFCVCLPFLGECPAIDFVSKLYTESVDVLEHHIKPLRTVPGVILEQAYLNKMTDGVKPLAALAGPTSSGISFQVSICEDLLCSTDA